MSNKMLIDASHPEEIRVVVTKGNRIEEFDFESEHKKQLKGNIYLARVTRVEPSLQAAFIEYGGNRHGFLAFSEIHPDYYQIPLADRQALLQAQEHSHEDDETESAERDKTDVGKKPRGRQRKTARAHARTDINSVSDKNENEEINGEEKPVDLIGTEDALEELPARNMRGAHWRDYKIQEVIKRRQILLVQVVKEERGNKGAALTTYLSLAGRYSVLMPNTARGGGISRKITNTADRKRLKDIVKGLSVPRGMGIILRTAGASRTKAEVRRDYEYLMRLWENVRNLTLTSIAPALVYEEGSLIKRSIRDLYNKNIDEISVAGEKGYREAKDFMRMLMPSHAKFVQPYRETTPIFAHSGIETQLDGMLQPEVGLNSGGYLVINQTEALVAIDVNSGRSTRENSVEETALQTNLEAAEEVARQLRLRDLAGLVVIDFIDMQEKRNIRAVEKKLKDCLKDDRARIQLGHISHFGLMEMSRQRIRASVLESTTRPCPHCFGTGYVRSESSLALYVLRVIEEYLQRSATHNITVRTPTSTALYVLNHKKRALTELEERFGLTIDIEADDTIGKEHLAIHKTSEATGKNDKEEAKLNDVLVSSEQEKNTAQEAVEAAKTEKRHERHNNRGRNRHKNADKIKADESDTESPVQSSGQKEASGQKEVLSKTAEEEGPKRRRRGRRGGRRNREAHNTGRTVSQAEPVGSFSQKSSGQTEQNSAVQEQKVELPKPEPVGFSPATTEIASDKQNKRRTGRRRAAAKAKISAEKTEKDAKSENKTDLEGIKPSRQYRNEKASEKQAGGSDNQNLQSDRILQPDIAEKNTLDADKIYKSVVTEAFVASHNAQNYNNKKPDQGAENLPVEQKEMHERPKNRTKRTEGAIATSEPVLTSSTDENGKENKPKKKGWWGRRSFF